MIYRCHWRSRKTDRRCDLDVDHSLAEQPGDHRHFNSQDHSFLDAVYDPQVIEMWEPRIVRCVCGSLWLDTKSWMAEMAAEYHAGHGVAV